MKPDGIPVHPTDRFPACSRHSIHFQHLLSRHPPDKRLASRKIEVQLMAGRSNTTLKKRQKEMARAEKQREKFAKRLEKKKGGLTDEITGEDGVEESPAEEAAAPVVPEVNPGLSW
jgi:hypothetical protein